MQRSYCHEASQLINQPYKVVFDFIQDPVKLGQWALGCFATKPRPDVGDGIYEGTSLFSGENGFYKVLVTPKLGCVRFQLGTDPQVFAHISIEVVEGAWLGYPVDTSLVRLLAWRPASMTDARWEQLIKCHEVEILLIKAQVERAGY